MRTLSRLAVLGFSFVALCGAMMCAGQAEAAPNPLCPGVCADGAECGADADCLTDRACTFGEACWPGLTDLIAEVLPAYRAGIGDAENGWVCQGADCAGVAGTLTVRPTQGRGGSATKTLSVASGNRYVLRAMVEIPSDLRVDVEIIMGQATVASQTLTGPRGAIPVALEFKVPQGSMGRVDVRLNVSGTGDATFSNAFVLVAEEHGVFLRFTSINSTSRIHLLATDLWRYDSGNAARHHSTCTADYAGDQPCLSLVRFSAVIEAGKTPWLDWADLNQGAGSGLIRAVITGAPAATAIGVEIAWRPNEDSIIYRGMTAEPPTAFVFALPESGAPAEALLHASGFAADALVRDLTALGGASVPLVATLTAQVPMAAATDADFGAAYRALGFEVSLALGARSFDFHPARIDLAAEAELDDELVWVVDMTQWMDALGVDFSAEIYPDFKADTLASAFSAWAAEHPHLQAALAAGRGSIIADLGPPRFVPWRGEGWQTAFQAWLLEAGVEPSALGAGRLADVMALDGVNAAYPRQARPLRQESNDARRWLQSQRFATETAGTVYRALATTLAELGVARAQLRFGSPLEAQADGFGTGPSVYSLTEGGRIGAAVFDYNRTEAALCRRWELASWTAWVRGHVTPALERAEFTGTPFELGIRQSPVVGADARSLAVQLGIAGFTRIIHDGYGPAPFGGVDAFGGRGPESIDTLASIQAVNGFLGTTLQELDGQTVKRSPVAILGAQSDLNWLETPAISKEEVGWYTMLSHAGWPVEVLAEDEIALGLLSRPDQARIVLVLMRRHVSRAAWGVIERWVEDGGHLIVGADLPLFDEAGQLVLARASWFGVDTGTTPSGVTGMTTFQWLTTDGSVTFQSATPWREIFALSGSVIAVADDSRPVAVRFGRGRGRVTVSGVALGEAYLAPITACEVGVTSGQVGTPVGGWSSGLRAAGESVVKAAGLRIDQVVKTPGVQMRAFGTSRRPFLAVLAHDARPLSFTFESRALQRCRGLTDVLGGGDAYVNLGSVLASVRGAALFTWDPDSCDVAIVAPRPDKPVDVPPDEILVIARGCAAGSRDHAVGLSLVCLVLFALTRVRRRNLNRR